MSIRPRFGEGLLHAKWFGLLPIYCLMYICLLIPAFVFGKSTEKKIFEKKKKKG